MSLLVAGIGTAVGIAGSIFGKSKEASQRRKMDKFVDTQSKNLESWYKKESNTGYLDTAEGSSQYQGLRNMLRENTNRVDESTVKTGGTAESNLAAKGSANKTLADGTRQMAAMGTQRQMTLRNIYQDQKNSYDQMKMGSMNAKADAWGAFAGNAGQVASNWIGVGAATGKDGWGALLKKRNKTETA